MNRIYFVIGFYTSIPPIKVHSQNLTSTFLWMKGKGPLTHINVYLYQENYRSPKIRLNNFLKQYKSTDFVPKQI